MTLGKITAAADALFRHGETVLDDTAKAKLRYLADRGNSSLPEVVIAVGHADMNEQDAHALGVRRAKAVKSYLMQLGVAPNRIYWESKGSSRPDVPGPDPRNRRVEIEFVGSPAASDLHGLGWMALWSAEAHKAQLMPEKDEWAGVRPETFLPQVEPGLRPRFLAQMALVAIREKDDQGLRRLRDLGAGGEVEGILPPALYAQAFGTPYARALLQEEAARVAAHDPERLRFAKRLWCGRSAAQRSAEVPHVLPAPGVLGALPAQDQFDWMFCAISRKQDLAWLRRHGVSADAPRATDGATVLHIAVSRKNMEQVALLLEAGASPNARTATGQTPLHLVTRSHDGKYLPAVPIFYLPLWDTLVRAGADPNAQDNSGLTPLGTSPGTASTPAPKS